MKTRLKLTIAGAAYVCEASWYKMQGVIIIEALVTLHADGEPDQPIEIDLTQATNLHEKTALMVRERIEYELKQGEK